MAQPGPLARSVTDLSLAMRVLTGGDLRPFQTLDAAGLRGIHIGFYTDNGVIRPSPAIRRAVTAAARALGAQGFVVQEWQPPNVELMWWIYIALLLTGGVAKARAVSRGSRLSWIVRQSLLAGMLDDFRVDTAGWTQHYVATGRVRPQPA